MNKCSVMGCTLPRDPRYPCKTDEHFGWCEPHGMHYEAEDRLALLTQQRIARAKERQHGR